MASASSMDSNAGTQYLNVTGFPFPLGPITNRRTIRTAVGEGIWSFEQEQGLPVVNVGVNVRMTVIRLKTGDLWVHNPVAPTEECVSLLRELGNVKYIVLGTTLYEHKVFVGPLSRRWPGAKVYAVPGQWSWPLDLPAQLYGIFSAGDIKDRDATTPWSDEIEQRLLNPPVRLGLNYSGVECAFFHKRSKTLICTDALIYVPQAPLPVLNRAELMELGRDRDNLVLNIVALTNWRGACDLVQEAQEAEQARSEEELLRIGWARNTLFALFIGPAGRSIVYPSEAFAALSGKWIVAPITFSFVYGGAFRQSVLEWVDSICEWDFQQIMPAHFAGPMPGNSSEVQRAFEVLRDGVEATADPAFKLPWPFPQPVRYRPEDIQALSDAKALLRSLGTL